MTYVSGVLFLHLITALDFERSRGTLHLPVIKSYIGSRVLGLFHHISPVVQWHFGSPGESMAPGSSWFTSKLGTDVSLAPPVDWKKNDIYANVMPLNQHDWIKSCGDILGSPCSFWLLLWLLLTGFIVIPFQ